MKNEEYVESLYPLSYMQEGMLYLELLYPGSGINTEQIVCYLQEDIDFDLLKFAWQKILERHPVLRTSLHWVGYQEPIQKVHKYVEVPWEYRDWHKLAREEQERNFRDFLEADRKLGFKISQSPLMRLMLIRLGQENYRLIWSFSHILLDARAFLFLIKEVFTLYDAYKEGRKIELPHLTHSYADYIYWQRNRDLKEDEIFWRKYLKGFSAATPICPKLCHQRNEKDSLICGEVGTFIDFEMTQKLKKIAKENEFTLNTIIQGAWALLLKRFTNEKDIIFGIVRNCRKSFKNEADSIAGLFINTIPLRVQIPQNGNLILWFKEIRYNLLGVKEFEHSPLIKIQKWSDVLPGSPLFESIIVYENYDLNDNLKSLGGTWGKRNFELYEITKYPLTLYAYGGDALKLKIGYQEDRCPRNNALQILEHLKEIIVNIALNPYQTIEKLPSLVSSEIKKFGEWNDTYKPFVLEKTIHQLFEEQVEKTPSQIALVWNDQKITYRQLNAQANKLANYLRKLGIGQEMVVGICMARSIEMIVALLAILKAGGAYLPLDPEYPTERIKFIINDANLQIIIAQKRFSKFFSNQDSKIIYLDSDLDMLGKESDSNPLCEVKGENLAYVIYTSGSTGKPKGVMIEHRNVLNFFAAVDAIIGEDQGGIWLAVTSLSFDISVLELLWTLCRGFQIILYPGTEGNCSIAKLIKIYKVTHFQCTPSMASLLLLDEEINSAFGQLKKLLIGGEAFPSGLAAKLKKIVKGEIINMYGPTETTIWSTFYKLKDKDDYYGQIVPIGRPIANTQTYIVNENFQIVPIGVPGELLIGGAGVARGYLKRPELTRERFIENPFGNKAEKVYRTGDLARYLPNGNIQFIGRIDQQVKIRGFRIELGEIEALLNEHPRVRESVVITREDISNEKSIIAYVVPEDWSKFESSSLRKYLKEKLPDYMIPSLVIPIKEIPKTPNNKIDRKSLPLPDNYLQNREEVNDPPRTDIEKAVAEIWEEALNLKGIGRNENFFELGGNSLIACGIILRVNQTCRIELPLNIIFQSPTISSFSKRLEEAFKNQALGNEGPLIEKKSIPVENGGFTTNIENKNINLSFYQNLNANVVEKALASIWSNILNIDRISRNDHFFKLGGKSLDAVKLFAEIENKFGKRLPLSALIHAPTIAQLARLIEEKEWEPNWSPLVPIQPQGSKIPFFCVHGHRGNVLNYYPLAQHLGSDQPFYGLQARGLDGKEVVFRTFEQMATDYLNEIKRIQPIGPYIIGGWCMGGYIALEMAQILKSIGEEVLLLILIDTPHPDYFRASSSLFLKIFERLGYEFSALKNQERGRKLSYLLKKTNSLLPVFQVKAERLLDPLLNKFNFKISHSRSYKLYWLYEMHDRAFSLYNPRPYDGRVAIFRSSKQPFGMPSDPSLGWAKIFNGRLELKEIPGHYINVFLEPSVRILGEKLRKCLEKC